MRGPNDLCFARGQTILFLVVDDGRDGKSRRQIDAEIELALDTARATSAADRAREARAERQVVEAQRARARSRRRLRILALVVVLACVGLYAYRDYHSRMARNDWDHTLEVAIVLVDDGTVDRVAVEMLKNRTQALSDRLTLEAHRYAPDIPTPFHFTVKGPVQGGKAPPSPASTGFFANAQHTWDLRQYTSAIDTLATLDPEVYDSRIYVSMRNGNHGGTVEGASQPNGRVGTVNVELDRTMIDSVLFVIAHELFHTLGASDKYDDKGHCRVPEGLAEPDRAPLYPQAFAELMARNRAVGLGEEVMPASLDELAVGLTTAKEIRWR